MVVQPGLVSVLVALAAALAVARSLVGSAVVVIVEDIATVVVDSIAAGVVGQAAERTVHCSEAASGVEEENMADREVPI